MIKSERKPDTRMTFATAKQWKWPKFLTWENFRNLQSPMNFPNQAKMEPSSTGAISSSLHPAIKFNFSEKARQIGGLFAIWLFLHATLARAQHASVLTYHNDSARSGQNLNETNLTPVNVNTSTFGLLFKHNVDGYIFAQPLVLTNVAVPDKGVHNVLYAVTENDSVYAFDADNNAGANADPLWQVSFLNPTGGVSAVNGAVFYPAQLFLGPVVGITATPVIDPNSGTLYVVAYTEELSNGVTNYVHRLHALNAATGAEQPGSPVQIICTNYPGTGAPGYGDNDGQGHVKWRGNSVFDRPGLLLANGVVYVGLGSHYDTPPWHGWVFAYNAQTLNQVGVFNTAPNGDAAGLWMVGSGPAADTNGNVYFSTGNGDFTNLPNPASYNLGDSVVRLATTNGLLLADYFTPSNQAALSASDDDLGSGGVLLLPDTVGSAAHPHLLFTAGKEGVLYLLDRDNLGHYNSTNNIVQQLPNRQSPGAQWPGGSFSSPTYFNNYIYYKGNSTPLQAFGITNGTMTSSPVSSTTVPMGIGGPMSVSAAGTSNAIVWEVDPSATYVAGPAVLYAFNAYNLSQQYYNSRQAGQRDTAGGAISFAEPTVANGKVYLGCEYVLDVYGNGIFLNAPTISPVGGTFTNAVTVTLADTSPGVSLYYTLDGTAPTTNSLRYTGPFTLTNSTAVNVIAAKTNAVNSVVTSASFINSAGAGIGTGLAGAYYSNVPASEVFDNALTPTLTRIDPTINFDWTSGVPAPAISNTNFAAHWTGMIQAQYSEDYTLYLQSDSNVRLWLDGQLVIDSGTNQAVPRATLWTTTVSLTAQQFYNVQIDFYYYAADEPTPPAIEFEWSSPSTPLAAVPPPQLYPETNPPPAVVLTAPTNGSSFMGSASVTLSANADDEYNGISAVSYYANGALLGTSTNVPYTLTAVGLSAGSYNLTAVAADTTGLTSTSAPVAISITGGSGLPYGLTTNGTVAPFLNQSMPTAFDGVSFGSLPALLSQAGAYADTPSRTPAAGLIPYLPNTILWSDGATKSRYLAVPNNISPATPAEQIGFAPTGQWTFPAGTVFVKNFDLVVNQTNPAVPLRRLETRLLVRDINGAAYGVTYKWRPDNSDADLLTNSLNENILVTNASGVSTQTWYYPSPADCLTCHTPVAGYALGLSTRQLNGAYTYPATGVTDNQLRTLNRLGLFYPAINESAIPGYEALSSITNLAASLVQRTRSYLDANCAQCHQPGGTGPTFDARYDTPLTNQNLINVPAIHGNLGYNYLNIVTPHDLASSSLYDRIDSTNAAIKMPPLARNLIDPNGVATIGAWINTLTELPPAINPAGGTFAGTTNVALQAPDPNTTIYYTLDGSTPTTNSAVYTGSLMLSNSVWLQAMAAMPGGSGSPVTGAVFIALPFVPGSNTVVGFGGNGAGWTLNGGALITSNVLTLTDGGTYEARSAFINTPQYIGAFEAGFIYQANGQADGATFVLQNAAAGLNALGAAGGGLGYGGIPQSAAVRFNIYGAAPGGIGTRLSTDGASGTYGPTPPVNLASGHLISVALSYIGTNLTETLVDLVTGAAHSFSTNYTANIPAVVGNSSTAWVGFTGGDGGGASVQTVSDFTFTSINLQTATPVISPPPGTFTNAVTVSLAWPANAPAGTIYYTLNGTLPTTNSTRYTGPLVLTDTTFVQAINVVPGLGSSPVTGGVFLASPTVPTIAGFGGDGSGWTLNGGAIIASNTLVLTDGSGNEARSAYYNILQPINNFQAQFIYQASGQADGTTFVVQNAAAGLNALGASGGGLGYGGIPQSAAVRFNIYSAAPGGMGTRLSTDGASGTYGPTLPVNLASGHPLWVTLNYNGTTLAENLVDLTTKATFSTNYTVNIPEFIGEINTAWVGFTGGDGGESSVQTVSDFTFGANSSIPPLSTQFESNISPVAPILSAVASGNQLSISWPGSALNYTLKFTTDISKPASWKAVSQTPGVVGGQFTVTVPIGATNTYFQLFRQGQ